MLASAFEKNVTLEHHQKCLISLNASVVLYETLKCLRLARPATNSLDKIAVSVLIRTIVIAIINYVRISRLRDQENVEKVLYEAI